MTFKQVLLGSMVALTAWGLGGLTAAADWTVAKNTAPQGIRLSQYFQVGQGQLSTGYYNVANVQDVSADPATNPTQMVALTDDSIRGKDNQVGSVWSQPGFEFDLNRDQTASMWLYFGNRGSTTPANDFAGDGMALVLQNDPRGAKAIAGNSGADFQGQTLGVWGYDFGTTATAVAQSAIQNSWALEFDSHLNNSTVKGANFDAGNTYDHIGWNYPGDAGTYKMSSGTAVLTHHDLVQGRNGKWLSDNQWHHLTVKWHHATGTMNYAFDDKDPLTNETATGATGSAQLDTSKLATTTGKVMWGFTGSITANNFENNAVIFESLPNLVDSSATANVQDLTTGQAVTNGALINAGDHLRYTYTATYNRDTSNPNSNWTNVTANVKVPMGLTYTGATITNGNQVTKISDMSNLTTNLEDTWKVGQLGPDNPTATVTVDATIPSTQAGLSIRGGTTKFVGTESVATAKANDLKINPVTTALTVKPDQTSLDTVKGQDVRVTGTITSTNSFTNSNLTIHPRVGETDLPNVTLSDQDPQGHFTVTIPASALTVGGNTLTLSAYDTSSHISPEATVTINVGVLAFESISSEAAFNDTTLTGESQNVATNGGWLLKVKDTRAVGSQWQLNAQVSAPFVASDRKLSGALVYEDTTGDQKTIGETATPVMTHTRTNADTDVTDVAGNWTQDKGLLLHLTGNNTAGTYSGQITWTLQNAPA
ncbi:hypothetical protein [Levilactobacillus zymae]|uniref:hypothetical protein n=1 Tax=Levilactobacillus zymae TaxID=267363 RepID=UPI0028B8AE29|nr:hypothetical protein [Levilactobacillus zymae]MDT6979959.1 hypothetical protein [Levilactobacillus zymae]